MGGKLPLRENEVWKLFEVLEKVIGSTLYPGINTSNQRTSDVGDAHTLQNEPVFKEAMFLGTHEDLE